MLGHQKSPWNGLQNVWGQKSSQLERANKKKCRNICITQYSFLSLSNFYVSESFKNSLWFSRFGPVWMATSVKMMINWLSIKLWGVPTLSDRHKYHIISSSLYIRKPHYIPSISHLIWGRTTRKTIPTWCCWNAQGSQALGCQAPVCWHGWVCWWCWHLLTIRRWWCGRWRWWGQGGR